METSYFAKSAKHPYAISIAGKAPVGFTGREYKKLAPKFWFYQKYKDDGDAAFYTAQYAREVLEPLNAREVFDDLGERAVLLCWEGKGKFCHRRLVAEWFEKQLGIHVPELQ